MRTFERRVLAGHSPTLQRLDVHRKLLLAVVFAAVPVVSVSLGMAIDPHRRRKVTPPLTMYPIVRHCRSIVGQGSKFDAERGQSSALFHGSAGKLQNALPTQPATPAEALSKESGHSPVA